MKQLIRKIAFVDAIGFHHIHPFELMTLKSHGICIPEPYW
jgi:hypothetical protein